MDQRIGAAARIFSHAEIGRLVVERVDFRQFHELDNLHRLRRRGLKRLQLFTRYEHEILFVERIAFRDFAALNHAIAMRAKELLPDAGAANLVNLVEADVVLARRYEQADGH